MAGGFVLVVGPSGAGKDTLIGLARERLSSDPRFLFARRVVTRAASRWEDHDTLDEALFDAACAGGRFALAWRAHGLGYALPGACLEAARTGQVVVCNVSRAVIAEARTTLPATQVVEVTASEAVLAQRLAARGRGEDGDLHGRLARARALPDVAPDLKIVNEGPPEAGADRLVAFLLAKADRAAPSLATA